MQIVDLHVLAGDEAVKTTAFLQAFEYYNCGMKLLGQDYWYECYELSLNVHDKATKSAYCMSDYVWMNAMLDQMSKYTSSSVHLVKSYSLKIKYFNNWHKFEDAINTAVHCLELLDKRMVNG